MLCFPRASAALLPRGPQQPITFKQFDNYSVVIDYSPAMLAAFFLYSWPTLMYFMVGRISCAAAGAEWPGPAHCSAADVARPDRSESPAKRLAAAVASFGVDQLAIWPATIDRFTISVTAWSHMAPLAICPWRRGARPVGLALP
jgi:hypothetical protein